MSHKTDANMPHILSTILENYEDHHQIIPTSDSSTDDECFLENLTLSAFSSASSSESDAKPLEPPAAAAPKKQPRAAKKVAVPQKATKQTEVNIAAKKAAPKTKETKAAVEPQPSSSSVPKNKKVLENAMPKPAILKSRNEGHSNRRGTAAAAAVDKFVTCYRCNLGFKGYNAEKDMDNHLKACGQILCVYCDKKYKSIQTLQIHQRKAHMKAAAAN